MSQISQEIAAFAKSLRNGQRIVFYAPHLQELVEATFGMAGTADANGKEWNASTYRADGSRVTLWFGHAPIVEVGA